MHAFAAVPRVWAASKGSVFGCDGRTSPKAWGISTTNGIPGFLHIPSGKHTKNYGKSPFLMVKLTINRHFQ